jgi:8-oxo-dGTP pyrophosphatase MutT (NUDIX family)
MRAVPWGSPPPTPTWSPGEFGSLPGMGISPFIAQLRERIGHDLLVLPSVAILPWDPEGRLLLARLVDTGAWATIGGVVEPDESPRDAAVREAAEEANITVTVGPVRAVLGGPEFRVRYPNGDETSYVTAVFDATVIGGLPRPTETRPQKSVGSPSRKSVSWTWAR